MIALFGLNPRDWQPHLLHHPERTYVETNCYTDIVIEMVAAAGHDPTAMLGSAVTCDFEIDQWTFFKPDAADLRTLYGIDVHEMQPYLNLPEQAAARLAAGQTLMPELDSFWLPDTAGLSYRTEHVKSSVVVEAIDLDAGVLRYFHNAGFHELSGEDYRNLFHLDGADEDALPPYVDLVRFDGDRPGENARVLALDLLRSHLRRRPANNPFHRFEVALRETLPELLADDPVAMHRYAFANPRMAGAAFELLATHVRWLFGADGDSVAADWDEVVGATKGLLFRLARHRTFDVSALIDPMAESWASAMAGLEVLAR